MTDDLRRMNEINREFQRRSAGTNFRNVVRFEFDQTDPRHPWVYWVGGERTCAATLDGAIAQAIGGMRAAAGELVDIEDAATMTPTPETHEGGGDG